MNFDLDIKDSWLLRHDDSNDSTGSACLIIQFISMDGYTVSGQEQGIQTQKQVFCQLEDALTLYEQLWWYWVII